MADIITSNNTTGNPYHDKADGRFTSKEGGTSELKDEQLNDYFKNWIKNIRGDSSEKRKRIQANIDNNLPFNRWNTVDQENFIDIAYNEPLFDQKVLPAIQRSGDSFYHVIFGNGLYHVSNEKLDRIGIDYFGKNSDGTPNFFKTIDLKTLKPGASFHLSLEKINGIRKNFRSTRYYVLNVPEPIQGINQFDARQMKEAIDGFRETGEEFYNYPSKTTVYLMDAYKLKYFFDEIDGEDDYMNNVERTLNSINPLETPAYLENEGFQIVDKFGTREKTITLQNGKQVKLQASFVNHKYRINLFMPLENFEDNSYGCRCLKDIDL